VSHKGLEANYATQYTHMYNDILSVLWHDRSTDRSIDQYKIEKIDRSTKELIVTSLVYNTKSSYHNTKKDLILTNLFLTQKFFELRQTQYSKDNL
jgi:hypothetical protein